MKQNIIKFSDERNKRFSIKTKIVTENGIKKVYKYPIFEEGMAHIRRMDALKDGINAHYDAIKPCESYLHDDCIEFEYVQGKSLEKIYLEAAELNDRAKFEEILDYHYSLIVGKSDNVCEFYNSEEFTEWFGIGGLYEGKAGLCFSNFDAIPSNIIIRNNEPCFIDYEWIMDFVMPRDLLVYNCVHVLYLDNPWIQKFYPLEDALTYLKVETSLADLQASYAHFFEYIICDENGASYAKDKITCLKPLDTIESIRAEWSECANNWKCAAETNDMLNSELKKALKSMDFASEEWKKAVEANERLNAELKEAVEANERLIAELKEVRESRDEYKQQYELVVNSRGWKMLSRIRNVGKKNRTPD